MGLPGVSVVKKICLPMQETRVWSLGQEDSLEAGMATHSSILAWRIPWTEEPGGLQSIELQRVRHNWSNLGHMHACLRTDHPGLTFSGTQWALSMYSALFVFLEFFFSLFLIGRLSWMIAKILALFHYFVFFFRNSDSTNTIKFLPAFSF